MDFTLPALITKNVVEWKCHADEPAKGRCDIIFGKCLLTGLGLNLKLSDHVIEEDYGDFKGSTTPMVDLGT